MKVEVGTLRLVAELGPADPPPTGDVVECPMCWALVLADKLLDHRAAAHAGPGVPDGR